VTGAEKVRIYDAFNEMVRVYGEYKNRTDRDMRMFALSAA